MFLTAVSSMRGALCYLETTQQGEQNALKKWLMARTRLHDMVR